MLALAAVLVIRGRGDGDARLRREGSVELEVEADRALAIRDEPDGYRIVYRVHERGLAATSDVVSVARPFESRTERREDAAGEGEIVGLTESAFGRVAVRTGSGSSGRQVLGTGPALAGADVRLPPVLDDALARGWLERREQREVAGRRCQVYRAGTSVLGGALGPPGDPVEEYADACFDEAGLLLEEWWVVGGEAIRQHVAVEVEEGAPSRVTGVLASEETTVPADRGGGSILRLRSNSAPPGAFFAPEDISAGFEPVGRYTVIPAQPEAFGDPSRRGDILASTADVWRSGIDLLVVDQGGSLEQRQVFTPDPDNETVDLDRLGQGEIILGLAGNEVRILRPAGRFIRVYGTLPAANLVEVARSLVETEGNEIVVDEDE